MCAFRIGSVRVNMNSLKKDILASSKKIHNDVVYPIIKQRFEQEKNKFIEEFDNHPITQQMYAGADDPSINYPGGPLKGVGNLFSFLGFRDGTDPALKLRTLLEKYLFLQKKYTVKRSNRGVMFTHTAHLLSKDEIYDRTSMNWTSRSWVKAVEKGVGGYQLFIRGYRTNSKSGGGVMSEHGNVRSGSFKNQSYFNKMYNNFLKKLTGKGINTI